MRSAASAVLSVSTCRMCCWLLLDVAKARALVTDCCAERSVHIAFVVVRGSPVWREVTCVAGDVPFRA